MAAGSHRPRTERSLLLRTIIACPTRFYSAFSVLSLSLTFSLLFSPPPLFLSLIMLLSNHTSAADPPRFSEDIDSACSTPFVSAPSSPGNAPSGYFFSAPASPMHYILSSGKANKASSSDYGPTFLSSDSGSFEFSSRFSPTNGNGSMISADELFFNGQIRPMKLSSHLQRPQEVAGSIADLYGENAQGERNVRGRDLRMMRGGNNKYSHRKARSMSPLRTAVDFEWPAVTETKEYENENESNETTPSCSASSSRSSSYGRNSRKWMFLKDLLHRSKSEGRANSSKERFWSAISFSPAKEKKRSSPSPAAALSPSSSRDEKKGNAEAAKKGVKVGKPANGVGKRRFPPSAHELHYTANRAQAEEMKKKTFLPYRQGLFGCLGFSSKSYVAFSGFTKNLNPISSR